MFKFTKDVERQMISYFVRPKVSPLRKMEMAWGLHILICDFVSAEGGLEIELSGSIVPGA
jgi:hypothetical protein